MEEQFLDIIKGKGTAEEREKFFRAIDENLERKKDFMAYERLWVLNNMKHKHSSLRHKRQQFQKLWGQVKPGIQIQAWQMVSGIAAVALITLLMAGAIFNYYQRLVPEKIVFSSPKGNISHVLLEDGSRIWLNSDSRAVVKKYGGDKVSIDLNGEGYFEVIHNPDREFIVHLGDYTIHDLGTTFNAEYDDVRERVSVALFDGAIDFRKGDHIMNSDLQAGQMICFDMKNQELSVTEADMEFITAWKEGKFVFVNRTMQDITKELEEWYDVHFIFENESIKSDMFSGVIKRKTSLEHLLRVLRLSAEVDYQIEENDDGSFTVIFQ
ncbi:FecR family protein [Marinilabilia salmonicolor]|uniref:FecR family protein n=1 Tax=Marinilabilia salmonicolor TaxID=989 RepID=A0A2T0XPI7_9BACT|nr:FecR family protein [Marinilabilia salmonicolor]PRZ00850.1 FecR family protein [Marinilabilia salmonicolor]RCW30413.1 FecR family protein [Marinilabilia salmonicolor]